MLEKGAVNGHNLLYGIGKKAADLHTRENGLKSRWHNY